MYNASEVTKNAGSTCTECLCVLSFSQKKRKNSDQKKVQGEHGQTPSEF